MNRGDPRSMAWSQHNILRNNQNSGLREGELRTYSFHWS